ncbi:MAG: hypothetical protein FD189_2032 [Elusimicrobia bacterium]|nr:MAG: hypothetical protein FD154_2104 [Elusimicrobiota bacterium]KAF0154218.1 MAG: hypothetical protein FD189_2032 [Elusimicrobiota bacterium]
MRAALKEYSPTFRIFSLDDFSEDHKRTFPLMFSGTACYSAVFADLNGDKRGDAVVFGEADHWVEGLRGEGKFEYFPVLAVLSEGTTGYRVVTVSHAAASRPVRMSLELLKAGTAVKVYGGREIVTLEDNDVGMFLGGGSMAVRRWSRSKSDFESIGDVRDITTRAEAAKSAAD